MPKTATPSPPYSTNLDNCYYLNPCGKAQGKQATKEQLASAR